MTETIPEPSPDYNDKKKKKRCSEIFLYTRNRRKALVELASIPFSLEYLAETSNHPVFSFFTKAPPLEHFSLIMFMALLTILDFSVFPEASAYLSRRP